MRNGARVLGCSSELLSSRTFSQPDQDAFAQLSGDANPIHMDPMSARRTLLGAVVVHGMHTVLWCMESLACSASFKWCTIVSIDVRFPQPLYVGELVNCVLERTSSEAIIIKAVVEKKTVASIRLVCAVDTKAAASIRPSSDVDPLVAVGEPEDLIFEAALDKRGIVDFAATTSAFADRFPNAAASLGAEVLRGLGACSRLVGMQCPGLRSVFSRLTANIQHHGLPSRIAYQVVEADQRFSVVRMDIRGAGLSGLVEAFAPPRPSAQPTMASISKIVGGKEFGGQTALIVGGSRGLGEVTAKAVAAGGGRTMVTYAVGKSDALKVVDDIREGGGQADCFLYDVTKPSAPQLVHPETALVTHVYYFPTPPISQPKRAPFDPSLFETFSKFYIYGLYNLCSALREQGVRNLSVFYPSTVFIDARPRNFTEYAMAKASGEVLCADLPGMFPGLRVTVARLEKLLTDQTASLGYQSLPPVSDVLIPLIRQMR